MSEKRFLMWSSNLAIWAIAFLGIIALVNWFSARHYHRFDMTMEKHFTLSEQTKKVVDSLEYEVKATGFVKDIEGLRSKPKSLMEQYRYRSRNFIWEFVDPDKNPGEAKRLGVNRYNTFVVTSGIKKETIFEPLTEEKLTNAIIKVISDGKTKVYFTTGHGEKEITDPDPRGYKQIADSLSAENFDIESVSLNRVKKVPEDARAVVVAGPEKDFIETEISLIKEYLNGGGSLLLMFDPFTVKSTPDFLRDFGIKVMDDIVIDQVSKQVGGDYIAPTVSTYNKEHKITENFNYMTMFPIARSLKLGGADKEGVKVFSLGTTLDKSWGETDQAMLSGGQAAFDPAEDNDGPLSLAAAVEIEIEKENSGGKGKIVVVGDSDFVANSYLGISGNRDLFINMLNWLAGDDERISIRPKESEMDTLIFSDNEVYGIAGLTLLVFPFIATVVGIIVNVRRKRS